MTTPSQPTSDMSPEERRILLARLLREKAKASVTTLPLSYGQQALYFIHQLAPESAAYNVAFAASIRSSIQVEAMRRVFQTIVDRHAALRTGFAMTEDGPVQRVSGAADLDFAAIDASDWDAADLDAQVEAAHQQPFDLAHASLIRVRLFTRAAGAHVLLMTVHHIVFDGWSMGIVLDEVARLYAAETGGPAADLAPVERQYGDFVSWQHAMLASSEGERLRAFWHAQLAGNLPVLSLPIDKPRPSFQSLRGSSQTVELRAELTQGLRALAKAEHTTLYTLFLAAFYALLHRVTGQEDLIIGSPMAGRGRTEFQKVVGYLVSPVPLRVMIASGQPFRSLLAMVRQTLHEAIAHEEFPFALLIEQLQPKREPGRTPIMEVLFTHQKVQILGRLAEGMASGGATTAGAGEALRLEPYPLNQENGQFDLSLLLIESHDALGVAIKYNTDLFEEASIARMAGHLQTLLAGILADPGQAIGALPLLTPAERIQIRDTWNATDATFPRERALHELIAEQAGRTPAAIAAVCGTERLSYAELERRSNQLAHYLRARGIGPDILVGIYLERSLDMLVALLGVLKAGGAYVPLDPGFPRERLSMMLEDAAAPVVITQTSLIDGAPSYQGSSVLIDTDWPAIATQPTDPPVSGVEPEHLAYVIFTSGSTGRPKGVQIPHRAVVNFLNSMRAQPGLDSDDILVAVTTLSFDIAVLELYLPLMSGARVVLASREAAASGDELGALVEQHGATVMQATPVTWKLLLDSGWRPERPFKTLCGGEALPPELARALLEAGVELWNMYGPTETTVWSTIYQVRQVDGPLPIGRPIDNTQVYVLNDARELQPIGVLGELYIGGAGVARGYHGRPDLTAERFVTDPFSNNPQARLYRTGDVARARPDGLIEVLGRVDHQVKIRGFRIELGEIEAALSQHPSIQEAVVTAREDGRGSLRLLAYLVAAGEKPPQAGELRVHLRAGLPDYMIPAAFIMLEALPRTPNGKIDRRALPAPDAIRARSDDNFVPPSTSTEQTIAAVWREVLSLDRVSAYDNFFDLGGHSLIAVETLARLERQLGPKLNPALIRAQTLGQLAASYDEALRQVPPEAALPESQAQPESPGLVGRLFGAVRRAIVPEEKQG